MEKFKRAVEEFSKKWSSCGKMELLTWDEYAKREVTLEISYERFLQDRGINFMPAPTVLVVDYDFCTDDLSDEQRQEFEDEYFAVWDLARMSLKELYCTDGSANGLYYGLTLFEAP